MRIVLIILTICCFATTWAQRSLDALLSTYNTRSVPYISVEELRMIADNDNVLILDTREKTEFDVSRIPAAEYVGYTEFTLETTESKIENGNTLIVYCSVGIRSEKIGEKLQQAGYDVRNLYGGIFEWKNKGYPVISPNNKETDSVHVCSKFWGKWLKNGIKVYE